MAISEQSPRGGPETAVSADGTPIAFERAGSGPPLVVVGGALADRRFGAGLARRLAGAATVLTFDRRGRGGSGDTPPHRLEREIEDLAAVLEAAGPPAVVYGHSSGGVLALEAAAAGVAMEVLCVYEPPYLLGEASGRLAGDLAARLSGLVAEGRPDEAVVCFLTEAAGEPEAEVAGLRDSPSWQTMRSLAHTLVYDIAVCGGDGAVHPERLARIGTPTLVLAGGASPDWASAAVAAVADAVPGAVAATVPGEGHRVSSAALAPVLAALVTGARRVPSGPGRTGT